MTIEFHPAIWDEDLPEIYAFIARENPVAAERVLAAVESTFDFLAGQPEAGVRYRARNMGAQNIRMLPVNDFPNYLVFYRIDSSVIRVMYVVHGARDLPHLFRGKPRS